MIVQSFGIKLNHSVTILKHCVTWREKNRRHSTSIHCMYHTHTYTHIYICSLEGAVIRGRWAEFMSQDESKSLQHDDLATKGVTQTYTQSWPEVTQYALQRRWTHQTPFKKMAIYFTLLTGLCRLWASLCFQSLFQKNLKNSGQPGSKCSAEQTISEDIQKNKHIPSSWLLSSFH